MMQLRPDDGPEADWTIPGVYDVGAGVYRIPLPLPQDGLHAVNVYAVRDGDGLVLIDSGWAISDDVTDWEDPDDWFSAPEEIAVGSGSWQVYPTPGHTRGHVVRLSRSEVDGVAYYTCA